jgi:phage recombination protein Bet
MIGSVKMVISYCKAAGLDPMQKPVHIVPMWDSKAKSIRDVVMPGIGLYRTQAARSGEYAGVTEPEFGEDVTESLGGVSITYPKWCRVTVRRLLPNGSIVDFTAKEIWKENYATAGKDSAAPNAMWKKRPYAQIAKCAEAQALRKAFPEFGAQPTADEMEGKEFIDEQMPASGRQTGTQAASAARNVAIENSDARISLVARMESIAAERGIDAYAVEWQGLTKEQRGMIGADEHTRLKTVAASIPAEAVHE